MIDSKLKYLFSFFTIWSITLYIICLQLIYCSSYKLPDYCVYCLFGMLNILGIMGSVVIIYKGNKIKDKLKVSNNTLVLSNLLFHIIPMIHIWYYRSDILNITTKNNFTILKSSLLFHLITLIYMYFNNLNKVYFGINQYMLMILPTIIYWISMIYLYTKQ